MRKPEVSLVIARGGGLRDSVGINLAFVCSIGRLTQLIALTGPSGTWRKSLIDKSVA